MEENTSPKTRNHHREVISTMSSSCFLCSSLGIHHGLETGQRGRRAFGLIQQSCFYVKGLNGLIYKCSAEGWGR